MSQPAFPPLLSGRAVTSDPMEEAIDAAREGCDPGLICYRTGAECLSAAVVFAPEVVLADAVMALPICGIGVQNALGALAPPEVGVSLEWSGAVRVNGGVVGGLRIMGPNRVCDAVPDWLVVALDLVLDDPSDAPGETPDRTTLFEEGCGDIDPVTLLEAWARHTLVWLHRWESEGPRPIHAEWQGLVHGLGQPVAVRGGSGQFLGVDERLGMLIKDEGGATRLVPLTEILEC